MKVSIITPVHNSAAFLNATAVSVLLQTYSDWEWLLIDDHSTDISWAVMQELAHKDPRIKLFSNTMSKGPGSTRNIGIQQASGHYMTFLDSDDCWFPEFLEKSIHVMQTTGVGFTFASYERWDEKFEQQFESFNIPEKVTYKDILYTCPIFTSTVMINIEKYGKILMPNLLRRQDYAFFLDYLKVVPFAYGIQEPLCKYRVRKSSISGNKKKVIRYQFNVYYNHQKLGLVKSVFYMLHWAYNGYIKYRNIK